MATSWYDPTGSNSGFYNSPQDFLFKSQGGTWYGQGPSGQSDAAKMPTMADYYFGGPAQVTQAPAQQPMSFAPGNPRASMSEGLPFASHTTTRSGGGGSINLGDNVSVPQGPLWQRYQALQANPAMMEADPAFRYMMEQGEEALGRSAGARRKRFAGETMLDFQRHAQGQAANYLRTVLPELRTGATQEYERDRQNILGRRTEATMQALQADPYGQARSVASQFKTLQELYASPLYAAWAKAGDPGRIESIWKKGQELNRSIWGG